MSTQQNTLPSYSALTMSSSPRLDAVELGLIIAESGLYGIFLIMLIGALEAIYERRRRGDSCILLLAVSACLFICITAHLALDVVRAFDAFIFQSNNAKLPGPSPATSFFENLSNSKYVAASCFYVVTTCVGDTFMIYRLYIVWGRNLWIIAPSAIIVAGLSATGSVIQWLVATKSDGSIFETAGGWINAFYALSFCTNLYCALFIAYRVWLSKRNVSRLGSAQPSPVQRVVNALIQSAALYCLCLLLSLILYVKTNNVQYIFAATNCPTIGIAFTMIVTRTSRVGKNIDTESGSRRTLRDPITMRSVAIKITSTQVSHHRDPLTEDDDSSKPADLEATG